MVDCLGRELVIGDKVVCADMKYADLLIGEVIGFTPKKIRIRYKRSEYGEIDSYNQQLKESHQVFKYADVVYCKDCKWRAGGCPYLLINAYPREDYDFCSDGERK